MQVKVVAWNMDQRSPGGNWATLRDHRDLSDADVYLLCEATRVPSAARDVGLTAFGNRSTKGRDCPCPDEGQCRGRRYSTAVAFAETSEGGRFRKGTPLPHRTERPGTWTAATVQVDEIPLTVIAIYGLHDQPYADSVRQSLSEVSPILEDEEYSRYLVLGGDLNILGGKPPRSEPYPGHQVLEEFAGYGLIDCLHAALPANRYEDPARRADMDHCPCGRREACTHTRTFFGARPEVPYQDDYLFASPALAACGRLLSCAARPVDPEAPRDHTPIIALFDV